MHADKLYHQMLDYEKQVEEAKAAGREPPPLKSLFDPGAGTRRQKPSDWPEEVEVPGGQEIPPNFKPSKPWGQLSPHQRELEVRSRHATLEQVKVYAEEASPFLETQKETRQKRKDKVVSWFGETIGNWVS